MRLRCGVFTLLMVAPLCTGLAHAQASPWSLISQGNTPWHALQQARAEADSPMIRQLVAQAAAIAGDEATSCTLKVGQPPQSGQGQWRSALDVLPDAMAQHRVVMLNENHMRSRQRAFLLQLIPHLHALGFRALAAETFAPDVGQTTVDGRVREQAGTYTRDPLFAAAVEQVLALGWELVPYEPTLAGNQAASKAARELGQAQGLARWLEAHPEQKLFVYLGGSHLDKRPQAGWMASHLVAITGQPPLTIAQGATACPQDSADGWPQAPAAGVTAVVDRQRAPTLEADWVVVHPPVAEQHVRPGWMAALPGRVRWPVCLPALDQPQLLRVFAAGSDDAQVIAADQFPVAAGQAQAHVWSLPGRYRVELEDERGQRQRLGEVVASAQHDGRTCLSPE